MEQRPWPAQLPNWLRWFQIEIIWEQSPPKGNLAHRAAGGEHE